METKSDKLDLANSLPSTTEYEKITDSFPLWRLYNSSSILWHIVVIFSINLLVFGNNNLPLPDDEYKTFSYEISKALII